MYSEELGEFIELILADDEITEKERNILHKKAMEEGIEPDEIDIIVEGMLAKRKKESMAAMAPPMANQQSSNSKHGTVSKCPQCGAVVEAGSVRCSECGYTFRGIKANSSVEKLSKLINDAEVQYGSNVVADMFGVSKRMTVVPSIIANFPVPTTKEDLLEFILFIEPKTKTSRTQDYHYEQKKCQAFKKKYKDCINKAKLFFPDDPQFQALFKKKGFFSGLFGKK